MAMRAECFANKLDFEINDYNESLYSDCHSNKWDFTCSAAQCGDDFKNRLKCRLQR